MSLDLFKASFSAMFNALSQFASQLPTFLEKVTGISSATLIKYFQYAVAAFLILLSMLILQRVYRLLLPRRFAHRYHISRLPKQTIIKRRLPISKNTYELRFPSWQYANADGTRDQRRKGNHVNWQSSCLFIDSYKIFIKNPLQMMRLVRHLREEGFEIAPCSQELKKQESQFSTLSSYRSGSSKELHRRFQSNPFEFEEYCAALFRAMGKRAQTTRCTNDGGYDVIVNDPDGKKGIVECKCYAPDSKIGRPMLQKLVGAAVAYPVKLDYIIFITTSDFSEEAKNFAKDFQKQESISFGLINGQTLTDLSEKYLSSKTTTAKKKGHLDCTSWMDWQLTTADLKDYVPADLYGRL